MNAINKIEEILEAIKWQYANNNSVIIKLDGENVEIIKNGNDEQKVDLSQNDLEEINKQISKTNGSIYPLQLWLEDGSREAKIIINDEITFEITDHILGITQTVEEFFQLDLESEKILKLMHDIIALNGRDESQKQEMLRQIADLEIKKLNR